MFQVTTRVAGSYVRLAVPEPVVSTGGTHSLPVSGTLKDMASASATPAFAKPRRTTKGMRACRRFKAFIFSSIWPTTDLSRQIVGIELCVSSHNLFQCDTLLLARQLCDGVRERGNLDDP